MKKSIIVFGLFVLLMPYRILIADDALSVRYPLEPLIQPLERATMPAIDSNLIGLHMLTHKYADKYGISYETMAKIINCESGWDANKQSQNHYTKDHPEWGVKEGDQELSFGLVQIHLPAHKNVTIQQAIDPNFALDFLAKGLSLEQGSQWSCWSKLLK